MRTVRCFALVAAVCSMHQDVCAQMQKVDSLKKLISTEMNTAQKYEVYFELAYELLDVDNNEAIIYADKAYPLALALGDSFNIVQSGRVRGQLLYRVGRLDEAIHQLNDVLGKAKRNDFRKELKYVLNALALVYTYRGDFDSALDLNFQLLVLRERDGDRNEISQTLNNIGLVYYKMANFKMAIEYYQRSYNSNKIDFEGFPERVLINIGLCYDEMRDFVTARNYIYKGLNACNSNCSNDIKMEAALALGNSFLSENNFIESKKHFLNSLAISLQIGNRRFQSDNLFSLAVIYNMTNNFDSVEYFLKESECVALEYNFDQALTGIYNQYLILYHKTKNFKKLSEYQKKYIDLKQNLFGEKQLVGLTNLQIDFQQHENRRTIALQQQSILLKRNSLVQQYFINGTLMLLALLFVAVAFLLFKSIQLRKKASRLLTEKVQSRTIALESKQASIDRAYKELSNILQITLESIKEPIFVLQKVSQIDSRKERSIKTLQYLFNLGRIARQLREIVDQMDESLKKE